VTLVDMATGEIVESRGDKALRFDSTVEHGLSTFVEVGLALIAIKADKLYTEFGYTSFDTYCTERFNIGSSQRSRLMMAATIAQQVLESSPIGEFPMPARETQVRELADLDDVALQREAWLSALDAADGAQPTQAQVRAAVAEVRGAEEASDREDDDALEQPDATRASGVSDSSAPDHPTIEDLTSAGAKVSATWPAQGKPVDPPVPAKDERSKAIDRRVQRLQMFCSSLHEFRGLTTCADREEVLNRLAASDRQIILNAERDIRWTT
jgi:hypothetical protein